ncbi:hypothetical protein [Dyella humicola]|uniref:hypothetical protein n=1 Tax=Dyella humicola TaxID=2992126 RepID=UPI0022534C54|nr:hypothetical protein [Dyella humicola]
MIARLYRPPGGRRQVIAVSRQEAAQLPPLLTLAVISITAPDRARAKLPPIAHMLRLSFADVDFDRRELSERARQKLPQAFQHEQAIAIHTFVRGLPPTVASIVVHCEGGFSRSSAIALGLANHYGYEAWVKDEASANRSVLNRLLEHGATP